MSQRGDQESAGDETVRSTANEPTAFHFGLRAVLLDIGFWTVLAMLTAANRLLDPFGPDREGRAWREIVYSFSDAYLWALVTPLIFWLAWRFGVDRRRSVARVLPLVVMGLVLVACMSFLGFTLRAELLGFRRFRSQEPTLLGYLFQPSLLFDITTYAGILAAGFAWDYSRRYRARREEAARLQAHAAQLQAQTAQLHAQLAEARLAVLRTQLNPHFLFNTLNAVSALVAKDPRGVRRMIARLSELLRYALEDQKQQEIPVQAELKLAKQYLEILEIRFQGRLETSIDVDPGVEHALVPNLILQPLAENAMTHGVGKAGGYGRIEVRASRSGDDLILAVHDTGPGVGALDPPEPFSQGAGSGMGLRSTRERLRELYGDDQRLELRPDGDGGMVAEIVLPFHTRAEVHGAPVLLLA